jgi:hypothetical protein
MSRGGRRPNAGRKPGVPNRVKQQAGLMRVAATRKHGRGKLAVDVLQKHMNRFDQLADEALKDGEPALFLRYSKQAIECAVSLSGYQTPKLSAVMTAPTQEWPINIKLKIFERQRVPLKQIEHAPIVDSTTAPAVDAVVTDGHSQSQAPKPEAPQPAPITKVDAEPKPEPPLNAYGTGSGRSLWEHPSFSPFRHGSRH